MKPVALITGATSAIGAAAAHVFAASGYAVAVASRRKSLLDELAMGIAASGGEAVALEVDVTDAASVDAGVAAVLERFGRLDAAFNNAGSGYPPTKLLDLPVDAFLDVMSVNATGTFLCMRAEIAAMLRSGGGAIVNMSSTAGLQGVSGLSAYCAGKYAVVGMSKAAALDYAGEHVRVNVVAPGPIATRHINGENRERIAQFVPVQRVGNPEDVAALVRWLCSAESDFVTGAVIPVDGGRLAGTPSFAVART